VLANTITSAGLCPTRGRKTFHPAAAQGLRAALNAALFRTGDQSRDFAVVLATNRPADLDPAVLDRMDEALEFPLPGPVERARILQIYLNSYIAKAGSDEGMCFAPPWRFFLPNKSFLRLLLNPLQACSLVDHMNLARAGRC